MIGIRADANEVIATGHIMRCITIAKQLKKRGEQVLFFLADDYACPLLRQEGMDYVCLYTDWKRMESELPALLSQLSLYNCDKVLVDSYQADVCYLAALREVCRVIYIDDMFAAVYPVDLLINYNAYYTQFPYEETYGAENRKKTELLLGTAYVPLRAEFSDERRGTGKTETGESGGAVKNILVSCGGGDICDALSGILTHAMQREKLHDIVFHTVVGRFNRNADRLEELAGMHSRIKLHADVKNMAGLMERCDAAVSAAGTVLYELCAMQVPTVFFVCADNQKYDSDFFAQGERMLFAGDVRSDRESCFLKICEGLERLTEDKLLRSSMKKKLRMVTDGSGAARIAEAILRLE